MSISFSCVVNSWPSDVCVLQEVGFMLRSGRAAANAWCFQNRDRRVENKKTRLGIHGQAFPSPAICPCKSQEQLSPAPYHGRRHPKRRRTIRRYTLSPTSLTPSPPMTAVTTVSPRKWGTRFEALATQTPSSPVVEVADPPTIAFILCTRPLVGPYFAAGPLFAPSPPKHSPRSTACTHHI